MCCTRWFGCQYSVDAPFAETAPTLLQLDRIAGLTPANGADERAIVGATNEVLLRPPRGGVGVLVIDGFEDGKSVGF